MINHILSDVYYLYFSEKFSYEGETFLNRNHLFKHMCHGPCAISIQIEMWCWNSGPLSRTEYFRSQSDIVLVKETGLVSFPCVGVYILIAAGGLVMLVGFFGCCGAVRESQCLLGSVSPRLFILNWNFCPFSFSFFYLSHPALFSPYLKFLKLFLLYLVLSYCPNSACTHSFFTCISFTSFHFSKHYLNVSSPFFAQRDTHFYFIKTLKHKHIQHKRLLLIKKKKSYFYYTHYYYLYQKWHFSKY